MDFTKETLDHVQLLQCSEPDIVKLLLDDCPVTTLKQNEVLITAGRSDRNLYVLLDGKLSVHLKSAETAPITFIEPGQTAGELSLIDHQPASAFVVAETDSRVLTLDEETVWELVSSSHAVARNLLYSLVKRLRYGNSLIIDTRKKLEQYQFQAKVDPLSGLFNRRWLNNMLPRQMHRSRVSSDPMSLVMIDIDHFKRYNDQHGHVAGDSAIRTVATTIADKIRPADMAARYGGEEFLLILPCCSLKPAEAAAERVRQAVEKAHIETSDGGTLSPVTISLGIAELRDEFTVEDFIQAADAALYRAKEAGRNRVQV
jgi:diguanylate cyclase (GGDEF)-like protein